MDAVPSVASVGLPFRQHLRDFSACSDWLGASHRFQYAPRTRRIRRFPRNPVRWQLRKQLARRLRIGEMGLILEGVAIHATICPKIQQPEDQRPQRRFRVTPANRLQGAPCACGEDRLVPDIAIVPRSVPPQPLDDLVSALRAGKRRDGAIRPFLVPRLHRGVELSPSVARRRQRSFGSAQLEIVLVGVPLLRLLEVVESP